MLLYCNRLLPPIGPASGLPVIAYWIAYCFTSRGMYVEPATRLRQQPGPGPGRLGWLARFKMLLAWGVGCGHDIFSILFCWSQRPLGPLGPLVQGPWGPWDPYSICSSNISKHLFVLNCLLDCLLYCLLYCNCLLPPIGPASGSIRIGYCIVYCIAY